MRRQHLAVRVDVDPGVFALFEQLLHIAQAVPGDEDARTLADAGLHLRDLRIPVRARVRGVEQRHRLHGVFSRLKHQRGQRLRRSLPRGRRKRPEEEFVQGIVLASEHGGVVGVGGDALQPVEQEFTQGTHVRVVAGQHAERRVRVRVAGQFLCARDLRLQAFGVKVRVRDREEERLHDEQSELAVRLLRQRHDLQPADQLVHQRGRFRVFAAHPCERTAGVFAGFLALPAEHFVFHGVKSFSLKSV